MIVEIVRAHTMETIQERIRHLEERIADGLEDLSGELSELQRIYRLASEEGELEYEERILIQYDPKIHSKMFTERVSELLEVLSRESFFSVSELAERLDRDTANVYRDLKLLESLGLVMLIRRGRQVKPVLLARRMCFRLDIKHEP